MGKTVLVMDDSEITLAVLQQTLQGLGYTVRTAIDLQSLETEIALGTPDLVVLDVQMPEAFGDDVGRTLRHVRALPMPILLFSSLGEDKLAARVADADLDGYVTKQAGVESLATRIEALIGAP